MRVNVCVCVCAHRCAFRYAPVFIYVFQCTHIHARVRVHVEETQFYSPRTSTFTCDSAHNFFEDMFTYSSQKKPGDADESPDRFDWE